MKKTKPTTISDIARLAKVSSTTVSRFLNGHYEYMSAETKARLEEIIRSEHYIPNSFARGLKSKKSNNIAVLIALASQTSTSFLQGICSECYRNGYTTQIYDSNSDPDMEIQLLRRCASDKVAGVLLYPSNPDFSGYEQMFSENKLPMVMINRYLPSWKYDAVFVDHYKLTRTALAHMWENGYRRILMLSDDASNISSKYYRSKAFLDFSFEHGFMNVEEIFAVLPADGSRTAEVVGRFLSRFGQEKCGIFTVNLPIFRQVVEYIKAEDLGSVTENLKICTYDSLGYSTMMFGKTLRVVQPIGQLGSEAAKLLIRRINGGLSEEPVVIKLEGQVIDCEK